MSSEKWRPFRLGLNVLNHTEANNDVQLASLNCAIKQLFLAQLEMARLTYILCLSQS